MRPLLRFLTLALGFFATGGTVLSLSKFQHWLVRSFDFPRVQLASMAGIAGSIYRTFFFRSRRSDWLFLGANFATVAWQVWKIFPYTPLSPRQVKRIGAGSSSGAKGEDSRVRLMISNVLMGNEHHQELIDLISEEDPDLVLAVETDRVWARALEPLKKRYPHYVWQPQENFYGMILLSRFPLHDTKIKFLVQDDIPSVHTAVELPSGVRIILHGLHPRPPEPIRDQDSTPRDAELVVVGRGIRKAGLQPTIVAGDLNDVAWSESSELFLRLSGLLDPRIGRGFYNSWNANVPLLRYPLDHVFHSNHFRLVELRRLRAIGSDHFPMLVELSYEPEAKRDQPATEKESGDETDAREKLANQQEAASRGEG